MAGGAGGDVSSSAGDEGRSGESTLPEFRYKEQSTAVSDFQIIYNFMLFVRALLVGYWSHVEEPQDKLELSSGQEEDGGQDEGSVTNTRGECQQTGLGRRNAFVETCRDNINCDLLQCL